MRIGFYTPDYNLEQDIFGCATFGIAGICDIYSSKLQMFDLDIEGINIYGNYAECINLINETLRKNDVKAAIVLTGNAGNENEFLTELSGILKCPVVGGGAAINLNTGKAGLISKGNETNILLITDPNYEITVSHKNIHNNILGIFNVKLSDKRTLSTIDGKDPINWLKTQKQKLNLEESDFEHMTFSMKNGVNSHLSISGGFVKSGRDLKEKMILRFIKHNEVFDSLKEFYEDENSIVFGCAGLRGILDEDIKTKALGLFLFGEICYVDGMADFGNLMLSKIKFNKNEKYARITHV